MFYSSEGNYTRQRSIQWPCAPDGIVFSNPYIYSILPSAHSSPTVQIHLASTLSLRQTVALPLPPAGSWTGTCFSLISSPSSAPAPTPKLLIATYPTDKSLQPQGSTIHLLSSPPLSSEIQHFLLDGRIDDAIGLVEATQLTPVRHLKVLKAVQLFASGAYQPAMELFVQHNVNPALVLSLFPKSISGALGVAREAWMELFGAPSGARLGLEQGHGSHESRGEEEVHDKDGEQSIHSVINSPDNQNTDDEAPGAALEALLYFLSDRRQKLSGAISSLPAHLPPESTLPALHALPPAALHALPSIPFTEMNPEELVRMAQVVYTALMRVYLKARPVLVGSLCRIENWCDVKEVEGLLKQQNVGFPVLFFASLLIWVVEIWRFDRSLSREKNA